MEKYVHNDGTYKFIYKLPSQSVLEFDFSFKKGENFENVIHNNFEQERIPKILLPDISPLMQQFLYEELKYDNNKLPKINQKDLRTETINKWLSIKTFKNHIECNIII